MKGSGVEPRQSVRGVLRSPVGAQRQQEEVWSWSMLKEDLLWRDPQDAGCDAGFDVQSEPSQGLDAVLRSSWDITRREHG